MTTYYLACDLGAESGRLILGSLDNGKLELEEIHRFPNTPVKSGGSMHWNIRQLFEELKTGLKKVAARKLTISSISTDSWGVDYLFYDKAGEIIDPTFHYRDSRTTQGVENVKSKVTWEKIFAETGIQFMSLNTLYQMGTETKERLAKTDKKVLIGDAFNYYLSGVAKAEESLASTTQMYNPVTKTWSKHLLEALDLPARIFPEIVPSGTKLGPLKAEIAKETGVGPMEVVASCSHDTGAAVAAVPGQGKNWAYLSSGTWSLMGVEINKPILTDTCRELNFTNEIGYGGTVRLLKNIIGLWIVQECRRSWESAGKAYDYAQLAEMATAAKPFGSIINAADSRFLAPDNMPQRIAAYCTETGQPVPSSPGEYVRCVLESLALLYRRTLGMIEQLTGNKIERLHIVGGGSKNALLNQFTANALQIPVLTGPVEATAAGNILVQALALGHLPSLSAAREVVHHSMQVGTVQPQDKAAWDAAYVRMEKLLK